MDYSNLFVCLMGLGTVFFGLICLIALISLMSAALGRTKAAQAPEQSAAVPVVSQRPAEDRQAMAAAVCAAVAEELGTDVSGIRILSFRKL